LLRLVLLALYLVASFSWVQACIGGGLDPNGLAAQPKHPAATAPAVGR
jgi:hypothetical protein